MTAAAPDAPVALLTAAAAAAGLPVRPPQAERGTIERAQRLVRAGGPAYVKLGQFVASARGLLPDAWVDAFAWCRDDVPSLPPGVAAGIVASDLGDAARGLTLDDEPLAAGSIGQAHRGRLADGTDVVVKVRRPGLRRRFVRDVETLALVAALTERASDVARAANLSGFVGLFARISLEELDLRLEAANLVESVAVLEDLGADRVRAPRPVPGLVGERVLVMDAMPGVPHDRARATHGAAIDGDALVRVGVGRTLEATLVHGVFHGDMHAGNVLVDVGEDGGEAGSGGGVFSMVDFGICGRLDAAERAGLVRFLLAFARGDAGGQVAAMRAFGAVTGDDAAAAAVARLQRALDRIDARTEGAITFARLGDTLGELLGILARGGVTMPVPLVLVFKNLLYLGDLAASVAPETDLLAVVTELVGEVLAREPALLQLATDDPLGDGAG